MPGESSLIVTATSSNSEIHPAVSSPRPLDPSHMPPPHPPPPSVPLLPFRPVSLSYAHKNPCVCARARTPVTASKERHPATKSPSKLKAFSRFTCFPTPGCRLYRPGPGARTTFSLIIAPASLGNVYCVTGQSGRGGTQHGESNARASQHETSLGGRRLRGTPRCPQVWIRFRVAEYFDYSTNVSHRIRPIHCCTFSRAWPF